MFISHGAAYRSPVMRGLPSLPTLAEFIQMHEEAVVEMERLAAMTAEPSAAKV